MNTPIHAPINQRAADLATLRAWVYTYTADRLGRTAPVQSRYAAHDALDRLERGDA